MQPQRIDQSIDQAIQHQAGGRLAEAEQLYRAVLAVEPRHTEANHNLGVLLLQLNRMPEALTHLKSALESEPRDGQLWVSYIDALIHSGHYRDARSVLESGRSRGLAGAAVDSLQRRIDVLEPDVARGPAGTGWPAASAGAAPEAAPKGPTPEEQSQIVALRDSGRYEAAEPLARALAARFPDDPWAWRSFSGIYRLQGRFDDALQVVRTAIQCAPEDPEGHFELGLIFDRLGQVAECEAALRRALQLQPRFAEAHNELGALLARTSRPQEAEASYRSALALRPDWVTALSSLAVALTHQGKLDEAEETFKRAIALEPGNSNTHVDLAVAYRFHGKIAEAEAALRKALQLQPENGSALVNLAGLLRDTSRLAEAEATLLSAIERFPLMMEAHSNLLFSLNYSAEHTPQYCLEQARLFGKAASSKAGRPYTDWRCAPGPARLRVGILSGDIHAHPVGFFLEGVLGQLDPSRVELFCYPTGLRADALTERVRPHFAAWRPLVGLSDEAAARQIHSDGIHVLIELSGHTPHNRLPILARKPAPVQVSWLGYFATTGLEQIDYFLADEVSVPREHQSHFTENVWYLPDTRLCFTPPDDVLPVRPLPALANGAVTFGSFQILAKLSDRTLSLWGRVLQAVPNSRLRIQSPRLTSETVREQLAHRLRSFGVGTERLSLYGPATHSAYMAAYGEVDIVLDTTPFPGGTTTCEALWMGVPTLTIAGDRLISRQGASLMRAAGLPDWVADDERAYVAKAATFASDAVALSELRAGLRARLRNTPLFDTGRFAAHLELALWQMWRTRETGA